MQLSLVHVLPIMASLTEIGLAAECYSQRGSRQCPSKEDVYKCREKYCGQNIYQQNNEYTCFGSNGWRATFTGQNIPTQQLCWDSTDDIIKQCMGKRNGGSYSQNGWNENINFCA